MIRTGSVECASTALDLFTVPETNTGVQSTTYVQHLPEATITPNAPIEFRINGRSSQFMDLNDTKLYSQYR